MFLSAYMSGEVLSIELFECIPALVSVRPIAYICIPVFHEVRDLASVLYVMNRLPGHIFKWRCLLSDV